MTNVAGRWIRHRPRHIGIDYSFGTWVKMERAKTRGLVVSWRGSRSSGRNRTSCFISYSGCACASCHRWHIVRQSVSAHKAVAGRIKRTSEPGSEAARTPSNVSIGHRSPIDRSTDVFFFTGDVHHIARSFATARILFEGHDPIITTIRVILERDKSPCGYRIGQIYFSTIFFSK